jgi:CRISPR-associated endonuclease/helicase Cas3
MPVSDFSHFFATAEGDTREPCDYQKRLACGARLQGQSKTNWLIHVGSCQSQPIDILIGLGNTAAVILSWLWNHHRKASSKVASTSVESPALSTWPRRLIYCLPLRTLVEQTRDEAKNESPPSRKHF